MKLVITKLSLLITVLSIVACGDSKSKPNPAAKSSSQKIQEEIKRDDAEYSGDPFNYQAILKGDSEELVLEQRSRHEDPFEAQLLAFKIPSRELRDSKLSLENLKIQKYALLNGQLLTARTLGRPVRIDKETGTVSDFYWIAIKPNGTQEYTIADLSLDSKKLTVEAKSGRILVYYPVLNISGPSSVLPVAVSEYFVPLVQDIEAAISAYMHVIKQARAAGRNLRVSYEGEELIIRSL